MELIRIFINYYNTTSGSWTGWNPETLLSGYNSTQDFPLSGLNFYIAMSDVVIPLNHTASNHTLITFYTSFLSGSVSHIDSPTINGTWSIWNGTATTPGSRKYELTYNNRGFQIGLKFYINGSSDWELMLHTEVELINLITPKNMTYFTFGGYENEIIELCKNARIIVSHAGAGSILTVFYYMKPIIIIPRLKKLNEHIDDHQLELAKVLENNKNFFVVYDMKNLETILKEASITYNYTNNKKN